MGVLQTSARQNAISIDTLSWEFTVTQGEGVSSAPKEGVYIEGLFLEGAGWDLRNGCLTEPRPMELTTPMPIIYFRPVEGKKKVPKGVYVCPCYYYPVRASTPGQINSFTIAIDLKAGGASHGHFVRRGTALLMQSS